MTRNNSRKIGVVYLMRFEAAVMAALPADRLWRITLFGSAPLQINVEPSLLSGDVDLFSEEEEVAVWVAPC